MKVSIKIESELNRKLMIYSVWTGRKKGQVLSEALSQYLDKNMQELKKLRFNGPDSQG